MLLAKVEVHVTVIFTMSLVSVLTCFNTMLSNAGAIMCSVQQAAHGFGHTSPNFITADLRMSGCTNVAMFLCSLWVFL